MHGIHVTGRWWKGKTWGRIASEAPEWVIERLEVFIRLLEPVGAQEVKLTAAIEKAAQGEKIPKGVGALSFEVLRREVGDWSRFNNRREVSSYSHPALFIGVASARQGFTQNKFSYGWDILQ